MDEMKLFFSFLCAVFIIMSLFSVALIVGLKGEYEYRIKMAEIKLAIAQYESIK